MDHKYIKSATLRTYIECNIRSFPLECFSILDHYGVDIYPYSRLDPDLREHCMNFSEDAFNYKGKLCYNDRMPEGRIRFTLMHELGHIILNHDISPTPEMEQEANYFASHILAPRMAIHYAKCKNQNDVAKLFGLTAEAAQYAFDDYKRWHRRTVYHKMTAFDREMYLHFYNKEANRFIYSLKRCVYCETELYNSSESLCMSCNTPSSSYTILDQPDEELLIAESHWLYGGL